LLTEYVRKEAPKFWESVNALFKDGAAHNALTKMVMQRIKLLLQYKGFEDKDKIEPQNILTRVEDYSLGTQRPLKQYYEV
jgi:hypothetical protein